MWLKMPVWGLIGCSVVRCSEWPAVNKVGVLKCYGLCEIDLRRDLALVNVVAATVVAQAGNSSAHLSVYLWIIVKIEAGCVNTM